MVASEAGFAAPPEPSTSWAVIRSRFTPITTTITPSTSGGNSRIIRRNTGTNAKQHTAVSSTAPVAVRAPACCAIWMNSATAAPAGQHHEWQSRADPEPAGRLKRGPDRGHQEERRKQPGRHARMELQSVTDQEHRGDRTGDHHQQVLHGQRQQDPYRHPLVGGVHDSHGSSSAEYR
jgi:hypothetical protein